MDWAVNPSSPKDRVVTFYHLCDWWVEPLLALHHSFHTVSIGSFIDDIVNFVTFSVAGKLKSLFLLFADHILKNMAEVLDCTHQDKQGL